MLGRRMTRGDFLAGPRAINCTMISRAGGACDRGGAPPRVNVLPADRPIVQTLGIGAVHRRAHSP